MSKPRLTNAEFLNDGSKKKIVEFTGLSTHDKPVSNLYAFGSSFFEVDTGKVYFYNEDTSSWAEPGGDDE